MQVPPTFEAPLDSSPPPGRVRFEAIGEAWRWYMADVGNWILSLLLVGVISVAPYFIVQLVLAAFLLSGSGGIFSGAGTLGSPAQLHATQNLNLISTLVTLPITVFLKLLVVGMQRRAILQVRGYRPDISEIFRLNGMGVQVLLFNVIYVLLTLPFQLFYLQANRSQPLAILEPSYLLALCGLGLVLYGVQMLLSFTPLIIVDQRLTVGPALKLCVATFGPQFLSLFGVMILTGLLAVCGLIACGIGVLFTAPVFYVVYGVIYNDHFRPVAPTRIEGEFGAYPRPQ